MHHLCPCTVETLGIDGGVAHRGYGHGDFLLNGYLYAAMAELLTVWTPYGEVDTKGLAGERLGPAYLLAKALTDLLNIIS